MSTPLLLTLPWLLALMLLATLRRPRELAEGIRLEDGGRHPSVSVIVPARNEAHNIRRVLESVAASDYPDFEILVVDDRSEDDTAALARSVAVGGARRIEVIDGEALPEGWLGKPWACWQGAGHAKGELLLFTDADTIHSPALLGRGVRELMEGGADAVTVMGRQLMESFWERVVQPQIFVALTLRYRDLRRAFTPRRWRSSIANGQYILFRRGAYEAFGGHATVRGEVAEDLRLAQFMVRNGYTFLLRRAEDDLATRMYRSLREIVEGWSKNVVPGGLQTMPGWLRPWTPPVMVLSGAGMWLAPPLLLFAALMWSALAQAPPGVSESWVGAAAAGVLPWSSTVVAASAGFWTFASWRFRVPLFYGLLYPLGAAVGWFIVLRSWVGMREVEWKGRRYALQGPGE